MVRFNTSLPVLIRCNVACGDPSLLLFPFDEGDRLLEGVLMVEFGVSSTKGNRSRLAFKKNKAKNMQGNTE